jgi:hypothetical protein
MTREAIAFDAAGDSSDRDIVALGREFDAVAAQLDKTIEDCSAVHNDLLKRLGALDVAITATPAQTLEGLRVKARAACWALLGDLDPCAEPTTDRRMALSIVRDLVRMHDPHLESPGALKKLTELG